MLYLLPAHYSVKIVCYSCLTQIAFDQLHRSTACHCHANCMLLQILQKLHNTRFHVNLFG